MSDVLSQAEVENLLNAIDGGRNLLVRPSPRPRHAPAKVSVYDFARERRQGRCGFADDARGFVGGAAARRCCEPWSK